MLEVVAIAMIMIASVAYVVTLDVPPVETKGQRGALEQKVHDALALLNDTPVSSDLGTTALTVAIHECLQNNCTRLEDHMDRLMPDGVRYAVFLSTKDGLYPVYAPREPQGEAVSARRAIEPAWSYQFLGLSQSAYDPTEDAIVVYGLPVFSGDAIHQGGSGLRVTVEGTRSDNAVWSMKGSGTTRAVDSDDTPTPSATSVFFHDGAGTPLAEQDVTATSLDLIGQPSGVPVAFHVRIEETGGGSVPAGSTITIQVPAGWTATGALPANDGTWTWVSDATDKNGAATGSSIVARLESSVSSSHVDFEFEATYEGHAVDYYAFEASLSAGAYAQAELLVRGDEHLVASTFEIPALTLSVPRPLGVEATTTWTLATMSPDPVAISRIEIAEDEGRAIFADVVGLSGGGAWSSEGDKLVWTGAATVSRDDPLGLTFTVTSSSLGGLPGDRPSFVPSVDLGSFEGRLLQEASPGLYRGVFLPADATYEGYKTSTGSELRAAHEASSSAVYRTTSLPGSIDYEVGYVLSLEDSLFGSSAATQQRTVEPGSTATIDVEVQSTVYQLATLGLTPSIDAYVYPPWSGDERDPIQAIPIYDGELAAGAGTFLSVIDTDGDLLPDPSDVGRHTLDVPIRADWLYGPYVVEIRVTWLETLAAVIDGLPVTEDVTRTASVYDYFNVRPGGDPLPASPVYDVHLVAWFEDWG